MLVLRVVTSCNYYKNLTNYYKMLVLRVVTSCNYYKNLVNYYKNLVNYYKNLVNYYKNLVNYYPLNTNCRYKTTCLLDNKRKIATSYSRRCEVTY